MFSWGKTPGSSSYPATRSSYSAGASRSDHLSSYLNHETLKPSTRRVSRDDTTYDTVFQTKAGHALIIRVHLPQPNLDGSQRTPGMTLVGVVATHPWLDGRMRITGYSPITSDQSWASSGLLLGNAVSTVVQHMQLNPPEIIEITDDSLKRIQSSVNGSQSNNSSRHSRMPSRPPANLTASMGQAPPDYETILEAENDPEAEAHMPIPAVPSSFPELDTMSRSEMQELIDNESKFLDFVNSMSAVTTLNDLKSSIFKGNVETAEANLRHEEELGALHAEVRALREGLREKVEAFRELEARQAELCRPPEKRDVIRKLTKAKKEAFEESEEIAGEWVETAEDDIDDFVEKFMERRILHHVRAAKIERLNATM